MLENSTVDAINTTSLAKTLIKSTTSIARTLTKDITSVVEHATEYAAKHMVERVTKYATLCTSTKNIISTARIFTKDLFSAARKPLDISMISAASFNHLIQKFQKDLRIQIYSVTLQDINIALAPK